LGGKTRTAIVPTEGYVDFIAILGKNTTEVLLRFRQFMERNFNAVCGLGAGGVTGPDKRSSWGEPGS
jgi:hypothetical protein